MQCYTPSASLKSKKKTSIEEIERNGILQLDFDYEAIKDYDIEELKQAVFSLPFIAFCGLSCSGLGFYALALIEEPQKLSDYAEHCFEVLKSLGVPADTSKGRNINDLRFLSYDANMLIRDNPQPLLIKNFKKKKVQTLAQTGKNRLKISNSFINRQLLKIQHAKEGERWAIVQKVAYTLGGLNNLEILGELINTIKNSPQFSGVEAKYCECAEVCFKDGGLKPIVK